MYTAAFVTAKVGDIALITIYYFVFALGFSVLLQQVTYWYDQQTEMKEPKTTRRLVLEVIANIFFIVIAFWIIRNLVERIPSPFEGFGGYQQSRLQYRTTSIISTLTLILFQTSLTDKIRLLNTRFSKSMNSVEKQ